MRGNVVGVLFWYTLLWSVVYFVDRASHCFLTTSTSCYYVHGACKQIARETWATHRNASTLADEVLDGLDGGADTGVVGDLLAVEGHVEVAADQDL